MGFEKDRGGSCRGCKVRSLSVLVSSKEVGFGFLGKDVVFSGCGGVDQIVGCVGKGKDEFR